MLPDVLGTYGDSGNAVVLQRRLRMRTIDAEIVVVTLDDPVPESLDIYTIGGGEDAAQRLAARHLNSHRGLRIAIERGVPVLAVCAGLQVLGRWFVSSNGPRVCGVGVLDVNTAPQRRRTIGEIRAIPDHTLPPEELTGFVNHRGGTSLGASARPLATIVGKPATIRDDTDGVIQGHVIGTYLHGPVLARNPELADQLLSWAMGVPKLPTLDIPEVTALRQERLRATGRTSPIAALRRRLVRR